ncbi:hypothetical protein [Marinibactrum halimedae]|uniref:Uncharacterized protein n=1 Tax=Marinibactrum halimedae TaxID=1444977 RepID=A0AA37T3Z8_9GAMM|nr:hypothetical protein [Marinibactrum halimedae]MCD9460894.1 hypothetical protein [Marinibactrum halimedae]GLS24568.1 hypothetical protein GCM10007877_02820 [Marinibactrum halimedae]
MKYTAIVQESIDPNGPFPHLISPVLRRLGWDVFIIPTFEAVHCFGESAFNQWIVKIVEEIQPQIFFCMPPLDFLEKKTKLCIRGGGTRLVGYVIENQEKIRNELAEESYDFLMVVEGAGKKSECTYIVPWLTTKRSVKMVDELAPQHEVLLLGRCSDSQEAFAQEIAKKGFNIACYGEGWANGPVTRPSKLGLMKKASIVISPFESSPKSNAQVSEAALMGCKQIIESHPGFGVTLLKACINNKIFAYNNVENCIELLKHKNVITPWLDYPQWDIYWPKILKKIAIRKDLKKENTDTLSLLYSVITHNLEKSGRLLAAKNTLREWKRFEFDDLGLRFISMRLAYREKNWSACEAHSKWLIEKLGDDCRVGSIGLMGMGYGLGLFGNINPLAECYGLLLAVYLNKELFDQAIEMVETIPKSLRCSAWQCVPANYKNEMYREVQKICLDEIV